MRLIGARHSHSRALFGIFVGFGLNGDSARATVAVRACCFCGRAPKAARGASDEFSAMTVAILCCSGGVVDRICADQITMRVMEEFALLWHLQPDSLNHCCGTRLRPGCHIDKTSPACVDLYL